jgi:hypothetical protein
MIIKEIKRLPVSKRIYVVEKTQHSIRYREDKYAMKKAADALFSDYMNDNELTAFTQV